MVIHLGHMFNKHFTDDTDITLCNKNSASAEVADLARAV